MHKSPLFFLVLFSISLLSPSTYAHEGHSDPPQMPAPKGGITRMNESYFFEYVYRPGGGTVYLYTHDAKPALVAGLETSAVFEVPRKPKVNAKVVASSHSWNIEATLPKAHRITLKFYVNKDGNKNHKDTLTFVVEPK